MMRRWLMVAAVALAIADRGAAQRAARPSVAELRGFDEWVVGVMEAWRVPGLAVGAVKDGQVVLSKGFGLRDVEAGLPVTPATVMAIGSNSKSFTVVLLGMLVDRRQLEWDRPVREYLPDFRLQDEFATREMTPRDLVTHRSGLPRHDLLWYGRPFTREELYHRLRYLPPTASFRGRYQYQNLMFMTAGYLAERLTARSWDDLVREWILAPLGMTRSSTSVKDLPAAGDVAQPYGLRGDSLVRLPFRTIDNIAPAGAINSSVADMLKYIQFRIDRGMAGGQRLLSESGEEQMQSPQMVTAGSLQFEEVGHSQYGLGLGIGTYRGRKTVGHGGGIDGFISAMNWMPRERIGVVVLTNLSGNNPTPTIVVRNLYDRLLGLDLVDWVNRQRVTEAETWTREEKERESRRAERLEGTQPSHGLEAYAGTYEHPAHGPITVAVEGDHLVLTLAPHVARLRHFHYDVWEIEDPGNVVPLRGRVRFLTDPRGEIDLMEVPLEPAMAGLPFSRRAVTP
jgi:CubicO group peptidase (beta-lactamase class C family)